MNSRRRRSISWCRSYPEREQSALNLPNLGHLLFGRQVTCENINQRLENGAVIKTTPITDKFTPDDFKRLNGAEPLILAAYRGRRSSSRRLIVRSHRRPVGRSSAWSREPVGTSRQTTAGQWFRRHRHRARRHENRLCETCETVGPRRHGVFAGSKIGAHKLREGCLEVARTTRGAEMQRFAEATPQRSKVFSAFSCASLRQECECPNGL